MERLIWPPFFKEPCLIGWDRLTLLRRIDRMTSLKDVFLETMMMIYNDDTLSCCLCKNQTEKSITYTEIGLIEAGSASQSLKIIITGAQRAHLLIH